MSSSTHKPTFQRQPTFLKELGLAYPCTVQDVEEAYRQKVWAAHPDRGGTPQQFVVLQEAYQRALEYARFHAGRSQWLARSMERYVDQQQLIAEIERLGGSVVLESLDWLVDEIGEDFAQVLDRIVEINLAGTGVDDLTIELLVKTDHVLGSLRRLDLSETRVTDEGVRRLAELTSLRALDVSSTQVSSAALELLNELPDLERLGLRGARIGWAARLQLGWSRPYLQLRSGRRGRYVRASRILFDGATVLAVAYVTVAFAATHMPLSGRTLPRWGALPMDKIVHGVIYAGLAFLGSAVVALASSRPRRLAVGVFDARHALLFAVLGAWAWFDEFSQPWVGRTFDWADWTADMVGVVIGVSLFQLSLAVVRWLAPTVWRLTKAEQALVDHRRALRRMLGGAATSSR